MKFEQVLGINRRNIDYIMELNRRELYATVDDKLQTKKLLAAHGLPTAPVIATADSFFGIDPFLSQLSTADSFVLKPARGAGGNGIVVVRGTRDGTWQLSKEKRWGYAQQRDHVENILYGTFSLGAVSDHAFAERRIVPHPAIEYFSDHGLPDIRIILHRGRPLLSMLRVPTAASQGKANLHAGGFAVAIDQQSGCTTRGWFGRKAISQHPEQEKMLANQTIPHWQSILAMCSELFAIFPLGYLGVDLAIDQHLGPLILELNARPGLEIQNVAGIGLRTLLEGSAG